MYGYEIARNFCRIESLNISKGAIYPVLRRLRRNGLVETFMQDSPEGPMRKYYKLTEKGRDMVCQMNAYWQAIRKQTGSIEKGRNKRQRLIFHAAVYGFSQKKFVQHALFCPNFFVPKNLETRKNF